MKEITTFEQFLCVYGRTIWLKQAQSRRQRHHGNGHCSGGTSYLLGGSGSCHECEGDFEDLLIHLYGKRRWLVPEGRATRAPIRDDFGPAA